MASAKDLTAIARDFTPDIIGLSIVMVNKSPLKRMISISFWDKTIIALIDRYDDKDIVLHDCSDSGSALMFFTRLIALEDLTRLASRPVKRTFIVRLLAEIIKGV